MTPEKFNSEMLMAKTFQSLEPTRMEYWIGYIRGLRRAYHMEKHGMFGTEEDHKLWLAAADSDNFMRRQLGEGYQDGLKGKARFYRDNKKEADMGPLNAMNYCDDENCEGCNAARAIDALQQKVHKQGKVTEADYEEMHRLNEIIFSQ